MVGAIIGDIVGSRFEFDNCKRKEFDLFTDACDFTDDTICTIATAEWLMQKSDGLSYADMLRRSCQEAPVPKGGYGTRFLSWIMTPKAAAYDSWGNGAAMRVSPVGWAFPTLEETLAAAEASAIVTHNHPEGIRGAQAVAAAVFLARNGVEKIGIREYTVRHFEYDLTRTTDEIRRSYTFDESCQGTVPEAMTAFLESRDFEDAIRTAVSLGGDSDTLACITGDIAEAYYGGIPDKLAAGAWQYLTPGMRASVKAFYRFILTKNCLR